MKNMSGVKETAQGLFIHKRLRNVETQHFASLFERAGAEVCPNDFSIFGFLFINA
jgi:hypothetical protein